MSTRATGHVPPSCCAACARRSSTRPGCERSGSASSVAHAQFMAQAFNEAGIPALAVSGQTAPLDRQRALEDLTSASGQRALRRGPVQRGPGPSRRRHRAVPAPYRKRHRLHAAARPRAAPHPDKPVLTVLDFVGHQHQEFRFDTKLRALTGQTRRGVEREVERGFPFLPSGCQIVMDRQAQALVLENLRSQVANSWRAMTSELRSYGDLDLPGFIRESGVELPDILRRGQKFVDAAASRRRPADTGRRFARSRAAEAHPCIRAR